MKQIQEISFFKEENLKQSKGKSGKLQVIKFIQR
jgi:hypothetical protein